MEQWLMSVLKGSEFGIVSLAASFMFGLTSAATTASCGGLPAMLVIVGYTGSSGGKGNRALFLAAGSFMLSSILVLALLGALSAKIGGSVLGYGGSLGFYAKKAVGVVALFIGMTALDLTPFRLPTFKVSTNKLPPGVLGAVLVGLSVGLATAGCATACSPLQLPVVLGFAALRGQVAEGIVILILFALGFTLPLVAVMLGVGMGKATKYMEKLDKPLRIVSGLFLVGLGIWFMLLTS
jgi:cytochrome c biogenesis protein CcdA